MSDILTKVIPANSSNPPTEDEPSPPARVASSALAHLPFGLALVWAAVAVLGFHLAYGFSSLSFLILAYLMGLFQLTRLGTARQAFYFGLGVGLLTVAPQLHCFWVIFGVPAIALWVIVAFWVGLFVALSRYCLTRFGDLWGTLLVPFLWTGLEYFRSELYYLRFSWLNPGFAFSDTSLLPVFGWLGMYGVGFAAMAAAVALSTTRPKRGALLALRFALLLIVALFFHAYRDSAKSEPGSAKGLRVAGVQLEFPTDPEVIAALDQLVQREPEAQLLVLSEYTFNGTVPETVKSWCNRHQRYLLVGGKDPAANKNFYDTGFVIGPGGDVLFKQVKSVPIQFFNDGLPAFEQKLWHSPWGKIGICICYDLSYTRVTDRLIRMGAVALLVPTMDLVDWGKRQHELHARVAPIRAAEYAIPIFRVASSGISQLTDSAGRVHATAPFPGQAELISGTLMLSKPGALPVDRVLAPLAVAMTALVMLVMLIERIRGRRDAFGATKRPAGNEPSPKPVVLAKP